MVDVSVRKCKGQHDLQTVSVNSTTFCKAMGGEGGGATLIFFDDLKNCLIRSITDHMELRKDFISSKTNVERNSGFTGEKGERERGGRLHKAFLGQVGKDSN